VTSVGLGSAAAADMLIGISLCYYLSQSRTGVRRSVLHLFLAASTLVIYSIPCRTDNLISTLMKYSLTTGFLTGIIACLVVITVRLTNNAMTHESEMR
jgi:hypothetical protein